MRERVMISVLALFGCGIAACFSEHVATTSSTLNNRGACANLPTVAGVVRIENFAFVPAAITIAPGATVTWVNCEPTAIPHTATSTTGLWTSGSLAPLQSYSQTFTQPGSYPYFCQVHPSMTGTVVVQ